MDVRTYVTVTDTIPVKYSLKNIILRYTNAGDSTSTTSVPVLL